MVDLDLRRLVVESTAAGVLAVILSLGVDAATDLSGRPLTLAIAMIAVGAVKAAAWLWDANAKKN